MNDKLSGDLLRGSLDLMVLSVLADGATYGYAIQKRLSDASSGQLDVKAGTLYPLLHRLEDEKLIKSRWDSSSGRRRKFYELTKAGSKQLERDADQWSRYVACLLDLLQPAVRGDVTKGWKVRGAGGAPGG